MTTFGCHSQHNTYGAHRKIWALALTTGERACGRARYSNDVPQGQKLNGQPLSRESALLIALNQPGGGVLHALDQAKTIYNVYSEQQLLTFKETLKRIKQRRPK